MCIKNSEEVSKTLLEWDLQFPSGAPDAFMPGKPSINPSLVIGKKARENISKLMEIISNA